MNFHLYIALIGFTSAFAQPAPPEQKLRVTCPAFEDGTNIPVEYTCDGANTNPAVYVNNIPAGTKSLVVIMEDSIENQTPITHWLAWNIAVADSNSIPQNSITGTEGTNSMGKQGYNGPCSHKQPHKYYIKAYALDIMLKVKDGATRNDIEKKMQGHILMDGELTGYYKQKTGLLKVIEPQPK